RVNPALTSIASASVLTPNMSVAVRVAASIPEIASPVISTLNASSPRATAVWDWTIAAKTSRPKSATSSPDAFFAAATSAPTLGGAATVATGATTSTGASAAIKSSAGPSTEFPAAGEAAASFTVSAGIVPGAAARPARLPFDSIALISACVEPRSPIAPHNAKIGYQRADRKCPCAMHKKRSELSDAQQGVVDAGDLHARSGRKIGSLDEPHR